MVVRGSGLWVATVQPPASAAVAAPMVAAAAAAAARSGAGGEREEEYWRRFDNSVNAVSFGFVATAILISMFLIMAIFERFLRPSSDPPSNAAPSHRVFLGNGSGPEFQGKFEHPSPKVMVSGTDVSVLMPGEKTPTFIAHTAPPPNSPISCPPHG